MTASSAAQRVEAEGFTHKRCHPVRTGWHLLLLLTISFLAFLHLTLVPSPSQGEGGAFSYPK
ncbi:MAG: hypothetical protein MAGBODY4_01493 [Candidatus Marinimicrobia bacterium]|nr:hypothetical protein [Candidatus Neomarinimicrobiota bacterium]